MQAFGKRVLREGLIAGLIGYAVVVVLFAIFNIVNGRSPFHTAALLGAVILDGLQDPSALVIEPRLVLAYNGVHLGIFLLVGLLAAWLASEAERGLQFWYLAISLFIIVIIHMLGVAVALASAVRASLPLAAVTAAGLLAATAMVVYLWRVHPLLRTEFREDQDELV